MRLSQVTRFCYLLAACLLLFQASQNALAVPSGFTNETVLENLSAPVDLAVLPSGEMLVVQKGGAIVITDPAAGTPSSDSYLVLPNVDSGDEKGLLGIALDPDFGINNYVYVYYHNATTNRARIARFIHDADHAHVSDEFVIWEDHQTTLGQSVGYHWGGGLAFGPDGYLYLSIGDKWDSPPDAQDISLTAGKILRVDPSGADSGAGEWTQGAANAHLVPSTNPFGDGAGGVPDEVWALGLRNAWRIHWDLPTARLFIGEVGGNIQTGEDASHEEISVASPTDGGANFGWPICEGPTEDCSPAPPSNYFAPIFSIQHKDSRAITMGPVYRGSMYPNTYAGVLFFADYTKGWLRYLTFDAAGNVSSSVPAGGFSFAGNGELGRPVTLKTGADGALYYIDIVSGSLRRIVYSSSNQPPVITQASADVTTATAPPLTVNFSGAATDPEGQSLTYTWDFGDGNQANGPNPSHEYTAKGAYDAILRVSDSLRTSVSAPVRIAIGEPPVPTIEEPVDGALFRAGDTIDIRGTATDSDSVLTSNSLRWTLRFLHDDHTHPILTNAAGTPCAPTGSTCERISIPLTGHDYSGDTGYEIELIATDPDGISASEMITIRPDKVDVTFTTNVPGGVTFDFDSIPRNGPFVIDTVIGFQHTITAPAAVQSGGELYVFSDWSNGPNNATQTVTVPDVDQTYTANYTNLGPVGTGPFEQQSDGTVSMQAEDFDANVSAGGSWSVASPAGATGLLAQAMRGGSGGRLEYKINFERTGTHYAYVRAWGDDGKSNSVYIGADGDWTGDYVHVGPLGSWQWEGPVRINVNGTGEHTLGVTIREAGTLVDKVVVLASATTPTGDGPTESIRAGAGGGGGGGGNTAPTVTITAPATGSSYNVGDVINFTGTATDTQDGPLTGGLNWNSSIDGDFGATGNVSISTLSPGTHTISASVTDSGALDGEASISVTVIDPGGGGDGGTGAFEQQPDGSVAIQAEDFDASVISSGSWSTTGLAGALGQVMQAGSGGRLEYRINFDRTGTHYVYVRAWGDNGKSNSVYIGFDGDWTGDFVHVGPLDSWQWEGPVQIDVDSVGEHTLGLSVREPGTYVDKIVVQASASTPTGSGPADSPREGGGGGGGGNTPPTVTITAPADGSTFNVGDVIDFTGTATDSEDGPLTAGLNWNSSIDGDFGATGNVSISTLSPGTHLITASVTDSGTLDGNDSISVTVNDPGGGNTAPTVMITAPATGSSFNLGDVIEFTGTATDTEDGPLTAGLNWNSSIDGDFGATGNVSISTLSPGTHTIIASVTDSGALDGEASISVTVIDPGGGGGGTGPFEQQPDGTVAMQAEDFDANISSGGSWTAVSVAGAIGQAMQAGSGGRLEYRINFDRTGTHYIYLRARGDTFKSNSVFVGIDGDWKDDNVAVAPLGSWQWEGPVAVNVGSTGEHTLGISMREPGTYVDKIVVLTSASTPAGNGPADTPRAGGGGGGGGNTAPTVTVTAPATGSSFNVGDVIDFTATATDSEDGPLTGGLNWNSSIDGDFGATGSVSISTLSPGTHTITASVTDSGGLDGEASITVTVIDPGGGGGGGTGPFQQQADGTVAMQAEDFDANVTVGGSWSAVTSTGAIGQAMQAGSGGRLEFRISFVRTGTHYVYLRARGDTFKSNSVFVGFDGDWNDANVAVAPLGSWQWEGAVQIDVGSIGVHTVGLTVREPGTYVDKIVVLTTPSTPIGSGPADTPRAP